jgi:hypothetical protein
MRKTSTDAVGGLLREERCRKSRIMPTEPLTRDGSIRKGRVAVLIIVVQNGTCGPAEAMAKPEFQAGASARVIPISGGCLTGSAARSSI